MTYRKLYIGLFLILASSFIRGDILLNTAYLEIDASDEECIKITKQARSKFQASDKYDTIFDEMFIYNKDHLNIIVECLELKKIVFISIASDNEAETNKTLQHFVNAFRRVKVKKEEANQISKHSKTKT